MKKLKILIVFGTRPEAVKMAPLVIELKKHPQIVTEVCVTAQHREMLDQVLDIFSIVPDYDLDIMKVRQTLSDVTVNALKGLESILIKSCPNLVLVHGDTTTTFSGALAAFYGRIDTGHVEAGLRTFDKYFPYPEEINRRLTGVLADIHFAPTETNRQNLIKEGVSPEKIHVTGNTVIDALKTTVSSNYMFKNTDLRSLDFSKRIIAVTAHRRENLGNPLENICSALKRLADNYQDVIVVYSVHLNPAVRETACRILDNHPRVKLISPLDPQDMHNFLSRSHIVMTDSGGLQEEAPSLGKPVLVLRNETERPEAVKAGTVRMAGTDEQRVYSLAKTLLDDSSEYASMAKAVNPYGDGLASTRIARAILFKYGLDRRRPSAFKPG